MCDRPAPTSVPTEPLRGLKEQIRSGALVLLIAGPLGLGILLSSGYPALHPTAADPHEAGGTAEARHGTPEALHETSSPHGGERHKIVVTRPLEKDVVLTEEYVCQIHARRHIKVRALSHGFLDEIHVNEGQEVEKGDLMFKIRPVLYQTQYDAELAEARLAELELENARRLSTRNIVSENEVALLEAKLAKARAKARQAEAELEFTSVTAPFSGIVDKLELQLGSLVDEGEDLTLLSDNSVLWVYFNVPEARYLEYMGAERRPGEEQIIELRLANGRIFGHTGEIRAIEAQFDNETGNIPFRADFPNPDRLLRHGQTGNVLIRHTLPGAIVIPQRATFEILDRRYVYVVDEDHVVHQRAITIGHELEDVFIVERGLELEDQIVLEGVRQVSDGEEVEDLEFLEPARALSDLKYFAI